MSTHIIPPEARRLNAQAAAIQRHHPEAADEIAAVRREAKFSTLAAHIKHTVEAAPPLTTEQRARLALLLSGGGRPDAT